MYLPLHKLKIPPQNARRAFIVSVCAFLCFFVWGAASLLHIYPVTYYAFVAGNVCLGLCVVLAVPYVALAASVMLSPMVIYLWLDSASLPMLKVWWFWLYVLFTTISGIRLMIVAEKKYPPRSMYEK